MVFVMREDTRPTDEKPIIIPEDVYMEICYILEVQEITLMGIA